MIDSRKGVTNTAKEKYRLLAMIRNYEKKQHLIRMIIQKLKSRRTTSLPRRRF